MEFLIKNVYVIHYTKLIERKKVLSSLLNKLGINSEFIEEFDQDQISDEDLKLYDSSETSWTQKINTLWNPEVYRKMKISEISVSLKQIFALQKIADSGEDGLIFEDDIVLKDNFVELFNNFYLELKTKEWDAAFFGSGCGLKINPNFVKKEQLSYLVSHPATKCADSYLIPSKAAKNILSTIKPFSIPYDFELAYHLWMHKMNVYWAEPTLAEQGSEIGFYPSSIR